MSLRDLNPILTPTKRLAALGMLVSTEKVDFAFMAKHLEMGDSDLSKQMRVLADAGYVKATKTGSGPKRRTWFAITRAGQRAIDSHLEALNALVLHDLPPIAERRSGDDKPVASG